MKNTTKISSKFSRLVLMGSLVIGLTACGTMDKLANVGSEPKMTQIENPQHAQDYRPVSMPMPTPTVSQVQKHNSLWRGGSRSFFKDQRATQVGDILTIVVSLDDSADISNKSTRTRSNAETGGATQLFGLEDELTKILPQGATAATLLDIASDLSNSGEGKVARSEKLDLRVAAVVTQVLPNGNLVVHGKQEMRINFEVRELQIAGIIRPEDIATDNRINFDQIAEARMSYGGHGHISDVQQPRYGQQVLDIIMPF